MSIERDVDNNNRNDKNESNWWLIRNFVANVTSIRETEGKKEGRCNCRSCSTSKSNVFQNAESGTYKSLDLLFYVVGISLLQQQ